AIRTPPAREAGTQDRRVVLRRPIPEQRSTRRCDVSKFRIKLAVAVAVLAAAVITTTAIATRGGGIKVPLSGYEETPQTLSTPAFGKFRAFVDPSGQKITYSLRYGGFETDVTQSHIHFGARSTSGGISVWLCANNPPITGAPAGT